MAALLEAFFTHGEEPLCAGSEASAARVSAARASAGAKPGVLSSQEQTLSSGSSSSSVLYLHGPGGAGQTSLLLQFGFTQAKAGKNVVLVMCGEVETPQESLASGIVPLTACAKCCMPVQTGQDNETWRRIHIKYLRSSAELQQFLCSLHMMREKASVLLVDGFERFFTDHSMCNVYQTLAYMLEAQEYMQTSTDSGLTVVAGDTDAFLLGNRPLLRRWCKFLEITPDTGEDDVFVLKEEVDAGSYSDTTDPSSPLPKVRYEFLSPSGHTSGVFRLLQVQDDSTSR